MLTFQFTDIHFFSRRLTYQTWLFAQMLRLFKLAKMFTVIRLGRIHRVFNRWEVRCSPRAHREDKINKTSTNIRNDFFYWGNLHAPRHLPAPAYLTHAPMTLLILQILPQLKYAVIDVTLHIVSELPLLFKVCISLRSPCNIGSRAKKIRELLCFQCSWRASCGLIGLHAHFSSVPKLMASNSMLGK